MACTPQSIADADGTLISRLVPRNRGAVTGLVAVALLTIGSGNALADQRVFATSNVVFAVDGLEGADAICQTLADSAGLEGTWVAWLSDGTTDARDRLKGDGPFVLLNGALVAIDRADLLDDNGISTPININEHHYAVWYEAVWTGTRHEGTQFSSNCSDWSSAHPGENGVVGKTIWTSTAWTVWMEQSCGTPAGYYCFEQDSDEDGIPDSTDNCPWTYNPLQEDEDQNGVGDACEAIFKDGFESGDAETWSSLTP